MLQCGSRCGPTQSKLLLLQVPAQPLLETTHVRVLPEHGEGNVHRDGALEDPGGEEEKVPQSPPLLTAVGLSAGLAHHTA